MRSKKRPPQARFWLGEGIRLTSDDQILVPPPPATSSRTSEWGGFPEPFVPDLPAGTIWWQPIGHEYLSQFGMNLGQQSQFFKQRQMLRKWPAIRHSPVPRLIETVKDGLVWSGKRRPQKAEAATILSRRKYRRCFGFPVGGRFLSIEDFLLNPLRFDEGWAVVIRAEDVGVPARMIVRLHPEDTRGMLKIPLLRALILLEQRLVPEPVIMPLSNTA